MSNKLVNKVTQKASELKDRVKSETPTHFKQTQRLGLYAAGVGFSIKILAAFIPALAPALPVATDLITHGLIVAGISKTAKVDKRN